VALQSDTLHGALDLAQWSLALRCGNALTFAKSIVD
jgi:hypothetical protein